jgi:hypothetical protein
MKVFKKNAEYFDFPQYWKINYKENRADGLKLNFKTIIYCKSKQFALDILKKKTEEDNPGSIVSNVCINRISANSRIKNRKLTIIDWGHIRNASFPNEVNVLFKKWTLR